MSMNRILILAVLGLLIGMNSSCAKKDSNLPAAKIQPSGPVDVLAEVGNRKITTVDLEQAIANLPENYRGMAASPKGKRQILENLKNKDLMLQEAEKRGYEKDETVKNRIKEYQARWVEQTKQKIEELQKRLSTVDTQVYENVMLMELNNHMKQDVASLQAVSEKAVKDYYDNYVRKLKELNPSAKAPLLKTVADKIRAILVKEQMLKDLEKTNKVVFHEDTFQRRYSSGEKDEKVDEAAPAADEKSAAVVQESAVQ